MWRIISEMGTLEKKDKYAYKLIAPGVMILFLVLIVPLLFSLYISLFKWSLIGTEAKHFIGLKNFIKVLTDSEVLHSLKVTGIYVGFSVVIQFILGLGIALVLNRPFKGCNTIRVISLIPMMISPTVIALIWRVILHSENGVLNYVLILLGFEPKVWLASRLALPVLICIEIWIFTPFFILMILAGLQSVPQEIIEASLVDGANWWQRLTKITLPMIGPVIMVALIFRTMFALRNFPLPWVLTAGGPGNATNVVAIELYKRAFRYYTLGEASSVSWILVIITAIISVIYIKIMARESVS